MSFFKIMYLYIDICKALSILCIRFKLTCVQMIVYTSVITDGQQCFRYAVREYCGQSDEEFLSRIAWEYYGFGFSYDKLQCGGNN